MAQTGTVAIETQIVLRRPRPELVLQVLRGTLVLALAAGCCSLVLSIAVPVRSGTVDPTATNSFGSSLASNAFVPRTVSPVRVPDAPTHLKLRSVPCASTHAASGTRCFVPG